MGAPGMSSGAATPAVRLLVGGSPGGFRTIPQPGQVPLDLRVAGHTARTLRGRKMRTVRGLFDEAAAALQFPLDFAESWAAFGECLSDMDLPPDHPFTLFVTDAHDLLADEDEFQRSILASILKEARAGYAAPVDLGEWWDRPPVEFHVLLMTEALHADLVVARWCAAGLEVSRFEEEADDDDEDETPGAP
jgi:hypothetical protein